MTISDSPLDEARVSLGVVRAEALLTDRAAYYVYYIGSSSRGRIITPLKDRYAAQVRTHYPPTRELELAVVLQEVGDTSGRVVVGAATRPAAGGTFTIDIVKVVWC